MKVHFYGKLDNLESCYTFQAFDIDGLTVFLQNAPRFGYEPATMTIKNPALFLKKKDGYYRYVIENFEINVVNGKIQIEKSELREILTEALSVFG